MSSGRTARFTYEESCRILQRLGFLDVGADGVIPPMPDHRPQCDDEGPLGVCFFRTFVGEGDLENLTLPRTFFGRSEIGPVSFKNTDLSNATLCFGMNSMGSISLTPTYQDVFFALPISVKSISCGRTCEIVTFAAPFSSRATLRMRICEEQD